jgi:hypothetical protein
VASMLLLKFSKKVINLYIKENEVWKNNHKSVY